MGVSTDVAQSLQDPLLFPQGGGPLARMGCPTAQGARPSLQVLTHQAEWGLDRIPKTYSLP